MGDRHRISGIAWFIRHYSQVKGQHLPAPTHPASSRQTSVLKTPGILDGKYCDLVMDLVLQVSAIDDGAPRATLGDHSTSLLQAALPSCFAGGSLHPPALYEQQHWCRYYSSSGELFSVLSRLPRHGCWIYPHESSVTSLEDLVVALDADSALRPVHTGYVPLTSLSERAGSIAPSHCYAESAIGLARCVNPIDMRLSGRQRFLKNGFWCFCAENASILMKKRAVQE